MGKYWLMFGVFCLVIIIINNVRFNPTIYAKCGGTHIAYQSGYITLNRTSNDNPWISTYRAPKMMLSSYAKWYDDKETCEGAGYYNPLHVFRWDKEAGKATYYHSGNTARSNSSKRECKILPVDSAPDWVEFRTTRVLNDSC